MKIKMSKKDEKFTLDELFERYQKQSKIRNLSEYTIKLFYNRSNTVINIKIKDLDLENQLIRLTTTKSRKQQIIPLSTTMCKILGEYLQFRQG